MTPAQFFDAFRPGTGNVRNALNPETVAASYRRIGSCAVALPQK